MPPDGSPHRDRRVPAERTIGAATIVTVLAIAHTVWSFTTWEFDLVGAAVWLCWLGAVGVASTWARPGVVATWAAVMSLVLLATVVGSPGYGIVTEPVLIAWNIGARAAALALLGCWAVWLASVVHQHTPTRRAAVAAASVVIVGANLTAVLWWHRPFWFVGVR